MLFFLQCRHRADHVCIVEQHINSLQDSIGLLMRHQDQVKVRSQFVSWLITEMCDSSSYFLFCTDMTTCTVNSCKCFLTHHRTTFEILFLYRPCHCSALDPAAPPLRWLSLQLRPVVTMTLSHETSSQQHHPFTPIIWKGLCLLNSRESHIDLGDLTASLSLSFLYVYFIFFFIKQWFDATLRIEELNLNLKVKEVVIYLNLKRSI